jgi:hypothetical protein
MRAARCRIGCAALLLALLARASPAAAGAWTQEAGRGEVIFSTRSTAATTRFDARGAPLRSGRFAKSDSRLALEWGLRDGTTLIGGLSGLARSLPAGFEGVGAGHAGLRQRLWRADTTVVSVEALAGASGDRRLLGGAAWDAPWHAEAALLAGRSGTLGGWPVFADARAAFRLAGGGRRHAARLDLTVGLRPAARWLVLAQAFGWRELGDDRRFPPRRAWLTAQASVVYEGFSPWLLQAGVSATLAGRETTRETGALVALWRRF